MTFRLAPLCVPPDRIRMNIFAAIDPVPPPWSVVDVDFAAVPRNAVVAPPPGPECDTHAYAETETNGGPDEDAGPRPRINNYGIVVRHHNIIRPRGQDRDIRATPHD